MCVNQSDNYKSEKISGAQVPTGLGWEISEDMWDLVFLVLRELYTASQI